MLSSEEKISSHQSVFTAWLSALCSVERGAKLQQQIVIGTPGTVHDWCTKYKLIDPKKITMFVLDEADVMIATQGHRDQSIRIHRCTPFGLYVHIFISRVLQ